MQKLKELKMLKMKKEPKDIIKVMKMDITKKLVIHHLINHHIKVILMKDTMRALKMEEKL